MGAKAILLLLAVLLPATYALPQTAQVGSYAVALTLDPEDPQPDAQIDIRLSIRKQGEMLQNFPATVNIYTTDESGVSTGTAVYHLEGTFPTSELLIPYQFPEAGTYLLTVDIPDAAAQDGALVIAVRDQRKSGTELPLWVRVVIGILIVAAFWKFRIPRRR